MRPLPREAGSDPGRRVDAIKTGFTVRLSGGGSIALFLAMRRQWHEEAVAVVTTRDAESGGSRRAAGRILTTHLRDPRPIAAACPPIPSPGPSPST
ncbi:hypothetical protein LZG04_17750 [Saccharothrix sp. S26]|uniref:hypothetical protein n=1 Tax=Saccharothrix sp. S26 TaxID=2907215 RepID=UPI001F3ACBBE|nr:hypothetical protein [Saccharothrix sp. S26]MCE6996633.1 hypothetical protein [Saccharothrix sp. S26]